MATNPVKRRSPKAKSTPEPVTEVVTDVPQARAETAMPPPTVTPHVAPEPNAVPASHVAASPEPETVMTPPPAPEPATPRPTTTALRQPEKRKSVFFPMLLGGLVAGGIGYGIGYMQFSQIAPVDLTGLQTQIDDMQAQISNPPASDNSAVDALTANVDALTASVDERFAAMNDQIAQAAQQAPVMGEEAQQEAVAQLSGQIATQQAELAQQRADLQAQLDATRQEAEQIQQDAVDAARTETARAALARVQGAIESGAPMQPALDDLSSVLTDPIPDALTAVAEGTPTLATLREAFPDASRAALAGARAAGEAGDDASRFGSFMRNQLNVRSVAPRDGTSVDAVLSRAEDALRAGRLNDALAEVATLPESARAAMSDWTAQAEARAAAVDAADQLDASLTAN